MKKELIFLSAVWLGLGTWPALAQVAKPTAPAAVATSDALFQAFGGQEVINRVAEDAVNRWVADPRIADFFKDTKPEGLSESLAEQICNLTGGPCPYTGANMKKAHLDMKIKKSDFNAVVEGLQDAMTAQHIPFRVQNQLLALLAPMHRDVITVR